MSTSGFIDLVKLSTKERQLVLAMLDREQAGRDEICARKSPRQAYRAATVPMVVIQPAGNVSAYLVVARNLSAGGIGVIHGGFIHPGTECRVMLGTVEGEKIVLPGHVRRCRHIKGNLHEVGISFLKAVEPEDFIPATIEPADAKALTQDPGAAAA